MARKKKHEEHENHERWLVSYADFITLLFAFFVVMYSISSVNEGKYRVLSSSLVTAFKEAKSLDPIQQGTPLSPPIVQHKSVAQDIEARTGVDHQVMPSPQQMADMQKLADEVEHDLSDLIKDDLVNVHKTDKGVEIEIKSSLLFGSGEANLGLKAVGVLRKITEILKKNTADINVEGFTDNVPISTPRFPSNWELSTARAASVVRLFTRLGLEAERLKAIGFAEFRPIASNSTEAGRNKNRRVTIMVLNASDDRRERILDVKASQAQFAADTANAFSRALGGKPKDPDAAKTPRSPVPTIIQPIPGLPISLPPPQRSTPQRSAPQSIPITEPEPKPVSRAPIRLSTPTLLPGGKGAEQ